MLTKDVETYLAKGCGRCEHFGTPECKVLLWTDTLLALRALLRSTELVESMKWGSPCYAVEGHGNVLMLTSFRRYAALSFFKGALLDDPDERLDRPGPNSQAMRLLPFQTADEVAAQEASIRGFVAQAIALEKAGARVDFKSDEPMPEELQEMLDAQPEVAEAYEALTPGRQRSYRLHVGGAKQAATRVSRAEKCIPKILAGKGFNER